MNMLDMHTREQANKIHLEQMHREAKSYRLLRKANQDKNLIGTTKKPKHLTLAFAAFIILFGVLLLAFALAA
jgi:hypothetical protein